MSITIKAQVPVDLGRRQADAGGGVHGFRHVGGKAPDVVVHHLDDGRLGDAERGSG
jgi:hypothetical protein